jgi:hypothetical protein
VHIAGFAAPCSQAAAAAAAEAPAEATAPAGEGEGEGEEGGVETREDANARSRGAGSGGGAHGEAREAGEEERCATAAAARKARRSDACRSRMASVSLAGPRRRRLGSSSGVFSGLPLLFSPLWSVRLRPRGGTCGVRAADWWGHTLPPSSSNRDSLCPWQLTPLQVLL